MNIFKYWTDPEYKAGIDKKRLVNKFENERANAWKNLDLDGRIVATDKLVAIQPEKTTSYYRDISRYYFTDDEKALKKRLHFLQKAEDGLPLADKESGYLQPNMQVDLLLEIYETCAELDHKDESAEYNREIVDLVMSNIGALDVKEYAQFIYRDAQEKYNEERYYDALLYLQRGEYPLEEDEKSLKKIKANTNYHILMAKCAKELGSELDGNRQEDSEKIEKNLQKVINNFITGDYQDNGHVDFMVDISKETHPDVVMLSENMREKMKELPIVVVKLEGLEGSDKERALKEKMIKAKALKILTSSPRQNKNLYHADDDNRNFSTIEF